MKRLSVAETPRCPATITAPGCWARCALPMGHLTPHDGVRWYEILTATTNWVITDGGHEITEEEDEL